MQCRLLSFFVLVVLLHLVDSTKSHRNNYESFHDDDHNQEEKTMYNRMICENEKLQIECKSPNHVLNIQRAYYGRYSITPCNKNHLKFAKGCTANNTIQIIKRLCENKLRCEIYATNSVFGDPCPNTINILEVIYSCFKTKIKPTEQLTESDKLTTYSFIDSSAVETHSIESTTPIIGVETSTSTTLSSKSSFISTIRNTHTTEIIYEKNSSTLSPYEKADTKELGFQFSHHKNFNSKKCYFSKNNITKSFLADLADFASDVNQLISLPCSPAFLNLANSRKSSGSTFYRCHSDGKFYYVNSTCILIDEPNWTENYKLEALDKNDQLINMTKVELLIDLIKNASNKFETYSDVSSQNVSKIIINAVDTLISRNDKWKDLSNEEKSKSVTKLFDTVDSSVFEKTIMNKKRTEGQNNFLINTDNILAEVASNNELRNKIKFPTQDHSSSSENVIVTLQKPKKSQMFMFMVYKTVNELISPNHQNETNKTNRLNSSQILNSNIISFKMNENEDINYLKIEPIELTFKHLSENYYPEKYKPICSFWNYSKETYEGYWSPDGCSVQHTNESHTTCKCNHLTHFAILIDVYGVHQNAVPDIHQTILSIITIVLSTISCISIILTLLAFRFVKIIKKNREQSATKDLSVITTHLCICLLASLSVFLIGIGIKDHKLKKFCSVIATMSHYFFLSAFFWMFLEGVQLYLMLVRIFSLKSSPIKKFCVIAYGMPFLIVGGSKLVDYFVLDSLGYGTSEHCWLSNHYNFHLTFIVPITLILIANFVILVIVIYGMKNSMASRQVHHKKQDDFFKSLLGFWCIILTLLGLPWLIGYLIIDNKQTIIFSYLFTIINTSQGTIVFIFHCIVSKNVREELIKSLRKQRRRLLKSTLSTSSSSASSKLTTNSSSNRSSKQLHRTTSDSSSFRTLKKSLDSARLLDRQSSNCSNIPKKMLLTDPLLNNHSNSQSNNEDSLQSSEPDHKETHISFFGYLLRLLCFCFVGSLSTDSAERMHNQENEKKINQNSQSFSFSSRSGTDNISPNYSSGLASPLNSNYIKISCDQNEETIIKLLNEPYFNVNTTHLYNIQSGNYKSVSQPSHFIQQQQQQQQQPIYLAAESNLMLALQKRGSGSIKTNYRMLNTPNIRRTLSQMSSESTNGQQRHYMSSIHTRLPSNSNINTTQIPTIPPPPLPIGIYTGQTNISSCTQKLAALSRKNTLNENRFSTFKASPALNENPYNVKFRNDLEKPIIAPSVLSNNKRLAAYDENQYLTPEYHSYSMVDSEFQSEYYCDDGICSVGVVEDEISNNYQEVIDQEFTNDQELEEQTNTYAVAAAAYSNNYNRRLKITSSDRNHKSKLKDLITMPEELDKEYSQENSNVSDTSIFKSITLENKLKSEKKLDKIPSVSNCSASSSTAEDTSANTTLSRSSTLMNNIDPDENSKAKRILQRI